MQLYNKQTLQRADVDRSFQTWRYVYPLFHMIDIKGHWHTNKRKRCANCPHRPTAQSVNGTAVKCNVRCRGRPAGCWTELAAGIYSYLRRCFLSSVSMTSVWKSQNRWFSCKLHEPHTRLLITSSFTGANTLAHGQRSGVSSEWGLISALKIDATSSAHWNHRRHRISPHKSSSIKTYGSVHC